MPTFDDNAVKALADLTKIGLADAEPAALAKTLAAGAADWDMVKNADASGQPLWSQKTWGKPWREDHIGPSFTPEQATAASGRAADGLFLVPEIL